MTCTKPRKVADCSAALRISPAIAEVLERTREVKMVAGGAAVGLSTAAAADRLTPNIAARIPSPVAAFRVWFVIASPSSPPEAGNAEENWHVATNDLKNPPKEPERAGPR